VSEAWSDALYGAPLEGIIWTERAVPGRGQRVIAPEGGGAWRHMAWPVADDLFALPAAPPAAPALVAGGSPAERARVGAALEALDGEARLEPVLTLDALRSAGVVVLLGGREALPAAAFAPLAARRSLVVARRERTFGLHLGIDVHAAAGPAALAERANAALRHPDAFDAGRTLGALAAQRQRASALNDRLAVDLEVARSVPGPLLPSDS
jgi:hypothetical protein